MTSTKVAPGDNPRSSRTKPTTSKPSFDYMLTSTGPTFFSPNAFLSSKVQSPASTILVLELISPWLHLRQAHPPSLELPPGVWLPSTAVLVTPHRLQPSCWFPPSSRTTVTVKGEIGVTSNLSPISAEGTNDQEMGTQDFIYSTDVCEVIPVCQPPFQVLEIS